MTKKSVPSEFAAHIHAREKSGESVAAYCRRVGISTSRFFYYQKKLKAKEASGFIEVQEKRADGLSIMLSNGMAISFEGLPDPRWVANLLGQLGEGRADA